MSDLNFHFVKRSTLLFAVFFLLYETTVYIANDMIMPGMLHVVSEFHASDEMVATSLTAYILGGSVLQIFLGPLSDRIGRRPVLLFGVLFFIICSLFLACSQTMSQFLIGRFFQGMGLCFISVLGYATIQEIFTEIPAVRLIANMNSVSVLAPLLGPLLGAITLQFFDWRIIFILIAVSSSAALFGIWKYMPEPIGATRIDGTINHPTPLNMPTLKRNFFELFTNKDFMLGSSALAICTIPIVAWIGLSPLILIKNAHLTVIYYALLQIPIFFFCILGNIAIKPLTGRMNIHKINQLGAFICFAGVLALIPFALLTQNHYIPIVIGISIYAFGLSLVTTAQTRLTLFSTTVPKGTASALMNVLLMLGISGGNSLATLFYAYGENFYFSLFCAACGLMYFLLFLAREYLHTNLGREQLS